MAREEEQAAQSRKSQLKGSLIGAGAGLVGQLGAAALMPATGGASMLLPQILKYTSGQVKGNYGQYGR